MTYEDAFDPSELEYSFVGGIRFAYLSFRPVINTGHSAGQRGGLMSIGCN